MNKRERFLAACAGKPVDRVPVWLMRQAGRFMEPYRKLRQRYSFLKLCQTPELAAKVTNLPLLRLDVDAAILFSDLLIPLLGLGFTLNYSSGEGPMISHQSIKGRIEPEQLTIPEASVAFPYIPESIAHFRRISDAEVPLVGFAGAPFTLASYMIEGGSSTNFQTTKEVLFSDPDYFHRIMTALTRVIIDYSLLQIDAGVDALQLFDSWAGCLSPCDYREHVLPATREVISALKTPRIPIIYFVKGSAGLLNEIRSLGMDVVSIDAFQDLRQAAAVLGPGIATQGNLDPQALILPDERLRQRIIALLEENASRPGYIFNLGHGILPFTDEAKVRLLVDTVKNEGGRFTRRMTS